MKANQQNSYKDPNIQGEFENVYNILNKVGLTQIPLDATGQRAENLDAFLMAATANAFSQQDTELIHELGRVPLFYMILSRSCGCVFFDGSATNTVTSFFVKCTDADTTFTIALW